MYVSNANAVWDDLKERFDKLDGSRTYNLHQEISQSTQSTQSMSVYFSKLKSLWDKFESMVPSPACNCVNQRILWFIYKDRIYINF